MNEYVKLGIWVAVIGVTFAILWRKGYLLRFSNYVLETREELRKCTWPTWEELRGSTVLVLISIALVGVFTVAVDFVIALFVQAMAKI
ncbi:MAG TPA: preprotein translocase subunit SecE [Methylomirabilota bacterium]|nr:preprotein translocase subunit SecE [Methylomirabilota bacterium]